MTTYNTIPDDEALLATKKQKSFKGLVVAAAAISFTLGVVAAVATAPAGGAGIQPEATTKSAPLLRAKGGSKKSSSDQFWWQGGGVSFRTVSVANEPGEETSYDNPMDIKRLREMVDTLHADGVTALTLNTVYDSGTQTKKYNWDALWSGLAMNDPMKVNPYIGANDDEFIEFANYVHSKNMKLMTWFNPSYMWTASDLFKTAEADMKKHCADASDKMACALGLDGSPAQWFFWGPIEYADYDDGNLPQNKPEDTDPPFQGDDKRWFADKDADAAYLSKFAAQPTTNFHSKAWQDYLYSFFDHWINKMGVDGFVMDWPDGYINAGQEWANEAWVNDLDPPVIYDNGKTMRKALTGVVRSIGNNRVGIFAELYEQPEMTVEYGFDAALGADGDSGVDRRAVIASAVTQKSASYKENVRQALDDAFTGKGGVDAMVAQCYYTEDGFCPTAWFRPPVYASGLPGSYGAQVNYNCWKDQGASYAPDSSGSGFSLEKCFSECGQDSKCSSISYGWENGECFKRGGVDYQGCKVNGGDYDQDNAPWYPDFSFTTFDVSAPDQTALMFAISAGAGYLNGVEISGPATFWSGEDWPGMGKTKEFTSATKGSDAFSTHALRMPLTTNTDSAYAMLRYDAKYTGEVGIAVYNLGDKDAEITVSDMPSALVGKTPTWLQGSDKQDALQKDSKIWVPARGYTLYGGLKLPQFTSRGYLECHSTGYDPDSSGEMNLAECFVACSSDTKCHGVTLEWTNNGLVQCYKRGKIDPTKCDSGDASFTTYSISQ